jgi:8-oxo-dGTP pyrophosphatase MutT (NUDIX family)
VQVEVLYISRTVVGADGSRDARRWSGQIAFPGGKSQGDETPLETACRESVEEVQLDLTSADFRLIGCLPPRTAKAGLPLNAFVFVHTSGMAQVTPDPFEVAPFSPPSLALSLSPHIHTR